MNSGSVARGAHSASSNLSSARWELLELGPPRDTVVAREPKGGVAESWVCRSSRTVCASRRPAESEVSAQRLGLQLHGHPHGYGGVHARQEADRSRRPDRQQRGRSGRPRLHHSAADPRSHQRSGERHRGRDRPRRVVAGHSSRDMHQPGALATGPSRSPRARAGAPAAREPKLLPGWR